MTRAEFIRGVEASVARGDLKPIWSRIVRRAAFWRIASELIAAA